MSDEPLCGEALRQAVADAQQVAATEVRVHKTHISLVFIAGERAYKFKRPIDLGFVDYSTRERRREMCQRELRLNCRLAPRIYRGLVSVTTDDGRLVLREDTNPEALEQGVAMTAFDEEHTLEARLLAGSCDSGTLLALGKRLAQFHANTDQVPAPARPDVAYQRRFDTNLAELLETLDDPSDMARMRRIQAQHHRALDELATEIEQRSRSARWRDGHGDLRAEHVLLEDEEIQIVDCVEFDDDLRALDVADDLGFLVMDITRLADHAMLRPLIDGYRMAGGDPGSRRLQALHGIFRALLRAKVAVIKAGMTDDAAAATEAKQTAAGYMRVADELGWRVTLRGATIICGPPASGKTTLAAALADRSRLTHLDSDKIREALFATGTPALPADRHSPEADLLTYRRLAYEAAQQIDRDGGVIVEATFRHHNDRGGFLEAFRIEDESASPWFVECRVPRAILLKRGQARDMATDASDADADRVAREAAVWDALDEIVGDDHLILRTDRPIEHILDQLATTPRGRF